MISLCQLYPTKQKDQNTGEQQTNMTQGPICPCIGHRMTFRTRGMLQGLLCNDLPYCYKYKSDIHFFDFPISTRWPFFQKEQLPDGVLVNTTIEQSTYSKSISEHWSRFPKKVLFFLMRQRKIWQAIIFLLFPA